MRINLKPKAQFSKYNCSPTKQEEISSTSVEGGPAELQTIWTLFSGLLQIEGLFPFYYIRRRVEGWAIEKLHYILKEGMILRKMYFCIWIKQGYLRLILCSSSTATCKGFSFRLYFMFQVDYFPSVDKSVIQLGLGDSYFISHKDIFHGRIIFFFFFLKTSPRACGN